MEIIKSEMISHPQHFLSSLGQQPWPQGQQNRQVLPGGANALRKVRPPRRPNHKYFLHEVQDKFKYQHEISERFYNHL